MDEKRIFASGTTKVADGFARPKGTTRRVPFLAGILSENADLLAVFLARAFVRARKHAAHVTKSKKDAAI